MINLVKVDGVWHVLNLMDGVRMCWFGRSDWDEPFDAEDTKRVEELTEEVCPKCRLTCLEIDNKRKDK